MTSDAKRAPQLAYSELQHLTYDEQRRRTKAAKIRAVLLHFLGRDDLAGLTVLDIGCSTGYTADELRDAGASVIGLDVDVPGLAFAGKQFGDEIAFVCADGSKLPFPDKSIDVAIFNHIYEHVVDPDAIMSEIRRVLRDDGAVYLGFANRMGIMEPHYRLPFLSWLPRRLAHRYVALSRRAPSYYEKFRTKPGLRRMCAGLRVWDYTYTVLSDAERFRARDMVPARLDKLPPPLWHALAPIMPTYIWVGTPGSRQPSGTPTRHAPRLLRTKR